MGQLASTHSLLVDDDDPSIQYTGGPWFQVTNAADSPGSLGGPLFSTLHGTNSSGGISFIFNGTQVLAAGAFRNTTEGAIFPTWICLVDGVMQASNPFQRPDNHWYLCANTTLLDGQHNITLQIQVPEGQQFWFDYMQYAPSENVPLDNANIFIDTTDLDITYGAGWINSSGFGMEALTSGTSLKLNFHGTSVIWVGAIPVNSTSEIGTLTYSIDGGPGGTADVPGSPSNETLDLLNQYLFQTAPVSVREHVLDVVYNGNAPQSAPLVLQYFVVLNRTLNTLEAPTTIQTTTTSRVASTMTTTAEASSSDGSSSDTPKAQGASPHSRDIGAVAGMAVGGCLVLVALIIFIFILHRRRGRFRHRDWYNWTYRYPLDQDGRD